MRTRPIDPRIQDLLLKLLNPEELGLATSAEMRDLVRVALGRKPVETGLIVLRNPLPRKRQTRIPSTVQVRSDSRRGQALWWRYGR